jgi:uncharacterized membrane protein (DUF485 family)
MKEIKALSIKDAFKRRKLGIILENLGIIMSALTLVLILLFFVLFTSIFAILDLTPKNGISAIMAAVIFITVLILSVIYIRKRILARRKFESELLKLDFENNRYYIISIDDDHEVEILEKIKASVKSIISSDVQIAILPTLHNNQGYYFHRISNITGLLEINDYTPNLYRNEVF